MTLLGLDFDNTLVCYDKLFHQLALEKNLIKESIPKNKKAIRDYLNNQGQDEEFTRLQGEVYGLRILEASPCDGMIEALRNARSENIKIVIISHKTKKPYLGPAYDLHKAAWDWLEKNGFFDPNTLGWDSHQVYFEESKESKINRICSLGCTHYVDDLPQILELLPNNINKILYDPKNQHQQSYLNGNRLTEWQCLQSMLTP